MNDDEKCCCGNCLHHRPSWETGHLSGWHCDNFMADAYGCDGLCYGGMNDDGVMCQPCGGIDTCEETRYIEAFATWGAALVILLTPIAMVAGFVLLIVATVKGRI